MASVLGALGLFAFARQPFDPLLKAAAEGQRDIANHPTTVGLTGDLIIAKLLERNRQREARLQQYSVPSTYRVKNDKGVVRAEARVVLRYHAPDIKEFKIVAESGSGLIRSRVFKPLMEIEVETAAGRNRHDSSVTPNNYTFHLLGEEDVDGVHCFVVQTTAKRADKYLFNGKVWIHANEFAVVQVAGQPTQKPSVWIKRVEFVRRYQKLKEFWLPLKNESITQVRMVGMNILTIDYDQYEITRASGAAPLNGRRSREIEKWAGNFGQQDAYAPGRFHRQSLERRLRASKSKRGSEREEEGAYEQQTVIGRRCHEILPGAGSLPDYGTNTGESGCFVVPAGGIRDFG